MKRVKILLNLCINIVETKKIKYDFVVKRNITILTGDSGSGKTVLITFVIIDGMGQTVVFLYPVIVIAEPWITKIGNVN